jgi:fatty-acyl-CoA synthase
VHGVRTGNVVAFSTGAGSRDSLVVIAETRDGDQSQDLARKIRNHLAGSVGISPDQVILVPPATLPKTSSGKLKRSETKNRFERGELGKKTGTLSNVAEFIKSKVGFLLNR